MKPKTPSTDDLRRAIDWLRAYEGTDDDPGDDMQRVADWLEAKADARDRERMAIDAIVEEAAHQGGPVSRDSALRWYRRNKPA